MENVNQHQAVLVKCRKDKNNLLEKVKKKKIQTVSTKLQN